MQNHSVQLKSTGYFSPLMLKFIHESEDVKPFYNRSSKLESFKAQLDEKAGTSINRKVLTEALNRQYSSLSQFENKEKVLRNVALLKEGNTFTITTGHQLCLFTGPLYFIYKIINTINLSKELSKQNPDKNFVPVFWMATEDHDFQEINHVNYKNQKISWDREEGGAVGRMELAGIEEAINQLEELSPSGKASKNILSIFREGYLKHQNLADATRYIVNRLFGNYGLVIIDGDDVSLKTLMVPFFKKELLENTAEKSILETNEGLKAKGFKIQVNPRDINLFYLLDNYRVRLTKSEGSWGTADGKYSFNEKELIQELENHPERFSPNVTLRPLYQEVLLPNLAYIGGGGELAYWLQLKEMFNAFRVPFPILRLRNSVAIVSKRINRKIEKLNLSYDEIFKDYNYLSKRVVGDVENIELEIDNLNKEFNIVLDRMESLVISYDNGLDRAVKAKRKKTTNTLEQLEKKMVRSAKRKESDKLRMLEEMKQDLFPNGGLQERYDNLTEMYIEYGDSLITSLQENLMPLDNSYSVVTGL